MLDSKYEEVFSCLWFSTYTDAEKYLENEINLDVAMATFQACTF